jgi:integrase
VRQALRREGIGPCKTARSRRTIVLPRSVTDLLAAYVAKRPRVRSDLLVLSLSAKPYKPDGFESCWRKVRERAAAAMVADAIEMHDPFAAEAGDGLRRGRFHDLRHTHATELLRAGVHIKVVAERLGDSEATVMRVYSHILPDMQQTAADALEPMMQGLIG